MVGHFFFLLYFISYIYSFFYLYDDEIIVFSLWNFRMGEKGMAYNLVNQSFPLGIAPLTLFFLSIDKEKYEIF